MPHINIHDLGRVREIGTVLARHGFGQFVRMAGLQFEGEPIEVKLPLARRLRMVLSDLGPTFVKLGQVLSVRPDLVPREVMEELECLQDEVPPAPFEAVRQVVEEELSAPLDQLFREFDTEPLASASIAQVHRAVLRGGDEVAVKVQRPGVADKIRSDLHILYSLAHLVTGRLDLPGLYSPVEIVQEFDAAINQELDFLQEGRAAERFRHNFANHADVAVPQVHGRWSTRRVLVLELFRGRRLSTIKSEDPAARPVMQKLIEATYLQVFEHGFFHGDPHPGNLFVMDDGRLAYLDFGITGTLTGEMQDVIVSLFLGLVFRDPESVSLTLYRAGATEGRVDLKAFRGEVERLMAKYHGASLRELGETASLVEFVHVAARYRIRLVPEYAVLARAASLLDGIARELVPEMDLIEEVKPLAQRILGSRLDPRRLSSDVVRLVQHAQLAVRDVPLQLHQLLTDLERGSLAVTTVDPAAERLHAEIRHAGIRVALALCTASLAVSGALLIAPWEPMPFGLPIVAILGWVVAGMGLVMFFGLMLHMLFAARIHPRELRRRLCAVLRFFLAGH